jgi:hypothetical protein
VAKRTARIVEPKIKSIWGMLANATRELMFTVQLRRAALRSNLAAQYRAASHQKQVTGRAANFGRMHFEIIGRSRYSKSTFLEHQILNAERIADTIPCIYWDASEAGIGFNPLGNIPKTRHHLVAAQVVYAIKAVTGENSWGPRLNRSLYNAAGWRWIKMSVCLPSQRS